MNCPKCTYPNPQGVTYCQMCYEVFNRSAADRYLHAQRRARREEQKADDGDTSPSPTITTPELGVPLFNGIRIASESLMHLDWRGKLKHTFSRAASLFKTYTKEFALATAIIVVGSLLLFVVSPTKRLALLGGRLEYSFRDRDGYPYLITFSTELKSWSERGGRLDTPLDSGQRAEMGNVFLKRSSNPSASTKSRDVVLQPKEWIITQSERMPLSIPLNHPSLKLARTSLNSRGEIVGRDAHFATRMGRASTFIMPHWPTKRIRPGNEWFETVGWVQTIGEWKIYWRGQLRWKLIGYERFDRSTAAHLIYHAEVSPTLWDRPAWAKNTTRITYLGTGDGEAYFDIPRRRIISNTLHQEGTLSIPIDNVYRIPADQRVGRMPRARRGQSIQAESGRILLQINEKVDVQKR